MDDLQRYTIHVAEVPLEPVRLGGWRLPTTNILLFLFTALTCMQFGADQPIFIESGINIDAFRWDGLRSGVLYTAALLGILFTHEMGHYITSRLHKVRASLPYFIPNPMIFGTFGAIIMMKSRMRSRKELLDIGAAGPLAGFVVGLPVLIYGFMDARVVETNSAGGMFMLGDSLLTYAVQTLWYGAIPDGYTLEIGKLGLAGWLAMFITALNLLPMGQLDGGHISYAMFGEKSWNIARLVRALLFAVGAYGYISPEVAWLPDGGWPGWLFWAVFVSVLGLRHPPPQDPDSPIGSSRRWLGIVAAIVFVLTFVPTPFGIVLPDAATSLVP